MLLYVNTPYPPHTHTHTHTLGQEREGTMCDNVQAIISWCCFPAFVLSEHSTHTHTPYNTHTHTHTHTYRHLRSHPEDQRTLSGLQDPAKRQPPTVSYNIS